MDRIASAEFRRTYARLERPVEVTVNGHVIGTWTPIFSAPLVIPPGMGGLYADGAGQVHRLEAGDRFGHSQPAPKPGRK
jgi:hypothetical protein